MILSCLGFPDFMGKFLHEVMGVALVLYFSNLFYFFSSKKIRALLEADNLLTEEKRNHNRRLSKIVIVLTIVGAFAIASIGHYLLHS
jgi:Na+/H+ antiporter NhaD/arsenite permease-like protein